MATQKTLASLLDMSERNLRDVLKKLNITDHTKFTQQQILTKYIRHLREQAAGRGGSHQEKATLAKIRESEASAQLKELDYYEKIKALVPVEELEPVLANWAVLARSEVTNALDKIIANLESKHSIEIDQEVINESLGAAFAAIASYPGNASSGTGTGSTKVEATA